MPAKLAHAAAGESNRSRRRNAPSMRRSRLPAGGGVGHTIGSYTYNDRNVPGRRASASSTAAPPHEWPKP